MSTASKQEWQEYYDFLDNLREEDTERNPHHMDEGV